MDVWEPLLAPGLTLLQGRGRDLRGFLQELAHESLHGRPGLVLWCDGDHGFDPYDFAELNLVRGRAADDGQERLLVKRCMTPFQWDTVLTRHLDEKLAQAQASLVIVNPFDRLWSHEEIQDWEQEDYTRFSLNHLRATAQRHRIPIVLGVDLERWWRTHPVLAEATSSATSQRWLIQAAAGRWKATHADGTIIDPLLRKTRTLLDYLPEEERPVPILVPVPSRPVSRAVEPRRSFRTRIVHPTNPPPGVSHKIGLHAAES